MAPCTSLSSIHQVRILEKDNLRLRKPVVEKMRRDRINSCIDQLKLILEKEVQKQKDPNTKLEKADILEMTVSFLKEQLHPQQTDYNQPQHALLSQRNYSQSRLSQTDYNQSHVPQTDYRQGYSQCWRQSVHFLSAGSQLPVSRLHQPAMIQRDVSTQQRSSSSSSPVSSSVSSSPSCSSSHSRASSPSCSSSPPCSSSPSSSSSPFVSPGLRPTRPQDSSAKGPVWRPW